MSFFEACSRTCFEMWSFLSIFKTSNMSNMGNIIWEYQQAKVGNRLTKHWQKRSPNIDLGPVSAQCWFDISVVGPMDKLTFWWHCRVAIGPNFVLRLAQYWFDLLMLSGIAFLMLISCLSIVYPSSKILKIMDLLQFASCIS